jgi:hypothetical protein
LTNSEENMIRYIKGILTVRGRKTSTLVLTGAVAAFALTGCSSSGNTENPKDASPPKQDTALQTPPDLGTGGGGGMGGAGGSGGIDASPDRAPIGGADSGVDAAPADRLPANLDLAAGEAGPPDGLPPNLDVPAGEVGAPDVLLSKDGLASDAGVPDAPSPKDGLAPDGGGTPSDGGGGEAGSGACPSPVHAWAYPVGQFNSIAWDRDGSLVTGATFNFATTSFAGQPVTNAGGDDLIVAKLDPATGNGTWVFTAGDANDQFCYKVEVTNGNLVVIGNFTGTLDIDPVNGVIPPIVNPATTPVDYIVGLHDSDGTGAWSKKVDLGGGQLSAVAGNRGKDYFLVCGAAAKKPTTLAASGTLGGGQDVIVAAIKASDGTVVWAKLFGGAMDQACYAAALDDSGNAYFAGSYAGTLDFGLGALTPAPTGASDQIAWVAKLSGADGTAIATNTFGTSGQVRPESMTLDPQGALIVTGGIGAAATFGDRTLTPSGKTDAFVAKLSPSTLVPLWARNMGGSGTAVASGKGAGVDSAGNVTVVGTFNVSLKVGPGDAALVPAAQVSETWVATLNGTDGQTLCAHGYGDSSSTGGGAYAIAINPGAAGANKDRAAIVGFFGKVIDFGAPTTALSAVAQNTPVTAYLLEM